MKIFDTNAIKSICDKCVVSNNTIKWIKLNLL